MKKLLWFLLLVPAACKEDSRPRFDDRPVVEAYLVPGSRALVKVSRKVPYVKDPPLSVDSLHKLQLVLSGCGKEVTLFSIGSGLYIDSLHELPIVYDSVYTVRFLYNNREVTASTKVPSKPTGFAASKTVLKVPDFSGGGFIDIGQYASKLTWNNPDGSYYVLSVQCLEENPKKIDDSLDLPGFNMEPVRNGQYSLAPMMFTYLGRHRVVLNHINTELALLYDLRTGNSLDFKELPTNVNNGLGIFTAINTDTLEVEIVE